MLEKQYHEIQQGFIGLQSQHENLRAHFEGLAKGMEIAFADGPRAPIKGVTFSGVPRSGSFNIHYLDRTFRLRQTSTRSANGQLVGEVDAYAVRQVFEGEPPKPHLRLAGFTFDGQGNILGEKIATQSMSNDLQAALICLHILEAGFKADKPGDVP